MSMSSQERLLWVLAEELESNIRGFYAKVSDDAEWVDSDDEAHFLMRRLRGIFIASLVAEIEEEIGASFSSVFPHLSDEPTPRRSRFWFEDMPCNSTPKGRAELMWAMRLAYTHSNGRVDRLSNRQVLEWLGDEVKLRTHFRGLSVRENVLWLHGDVTFPALKTALEIRSIMLPT